MVSHPLGRDFVARLKALDDTVVPYELPDEGGLLDLIKVCAGRTRHASGASQLDAP